MAKENLNELIENTKNADTLEVFVDSLTKSQVIELMRVLKNAWITFTDFDRETDAKVLHISEYVVGNCIVTTHIENAEVNAGTNIVLQKKLFPLCISFKIKTSNNGDIIAIGSGRNSFCTKEEFKDFMNIMNGLLSAKKKSFGLFYREPKIDDEEIHIEEPKRKPKLYDLRNQEF